MSMVSPEALTRDGSDPQWSSARSLVFTTTRHRAKSTFPELIGALAPRAFFTNSLLHDINFAIEGVRVCLAAFAFLDRSLSSSH